MNLVTSLLAPVTPPAKAMQNYTQHLFQLSVLRCRLNALELELYPSDQHQQCFHRQAARLLEQTIDTDMLTENNAPQPPLDATIQEDKPSIRSPLPSDEEHAVEQDTSSLIPIASSARRKRPARHSHRRSQLKATQPPLKATQQLTTPKDPPESHPHSENPIFTPENVENAMAVVQATIDVDFPSENDITTDLGIEPSIVDASDEHIQPIPEFPISVPSESELLENYENSDTLFLDDLSAMLSDIPDDPAELPSPLLLRPELDNLPEIIPPDISNHSNEFESHNTEDDDQKFLQSDEVMLEIISASAPQLYEDIEALSDALDLDPDNMSLWLARAKVWQQQGDLAAAISDCYRAIQKSSEDQEPQALLEGLLREANIPQYRSILLPKR